MSDAFDGVKSDKNREDTMKTSHTLRMPHQGPCNCDNCGKLMQWKEIDWCITNNGYLLCSSCMLTWVRENRYHKETRKEIVTFQTSSAVS
jgi:hypothetical protein